MNDRGLVLQKKGNKVTLVTPSGEFLTMKTSDETLLPGSTMVIPSRGTRRALFLKIVPAMALSAVLVFCSFFGYHGYLQARPALAYVTIDSVGSIELLVNDKGLVKAATPLDEDGKHLLEQIKYHMRPAQEVAQILVEAQTNTESDTDDPIIDLVISFVPISNETDKSHESRMQALEKKVTGALDKIAEKDNKGQAIPPGQAKKAPNVTFLTLDMETREIAKKLGISAGRAASWALSKHEQDRLGQDHQDPKNPQDQGPGRLGEDGQEIEPTEGTQSGTYTPPGDGNRHGSGPSQSSQSGQPGQSDQPDRPGQPSVPGQKPGQSPGTNPPDQSGKPGQSGQQGQSDSSGQSGRPGQSGKPDKNSDFSWPNLLGDPDSSEILKAIRKRLPGFDLDQYLNNMEPNERARFMKDLTRKWLDQTIKDIMKELGKTARSEGTGNSGKGESGGNGR